MNWLLMVQIARHCDCIVLGLVSRSYFAADCPHNRSFTLITAGLFPPWRYSYKPPTESYHAIERSAGSSSIFRPPTPNASELAKLFGFAENNEAARYVSVDIDAGRLVTEMAVVLFTCGLIALSLCSK